MLMSLECLITHFVLQRLRRWLWEAASLVQQGLKGLQPMTGQGIEMWAQSQSFWVS